MDAHDNGMSTDFKNQLFQSLDSKSPYYRNLNPFLAEKPLVNSSKDTFLLPSSCMSLIKSKIRIFTQKPIDT